MTSILITGTTGFLGSHFLLRSQALPIQTIYCLVRGENIAHVKGRVLKALNLANEGYAVKYNIDDILHRCVFILSDIEIDLCGVDSNLLRDICQNPVHSVWHFAASLSYEDDKSELIERRNILGTQNIVALAEKVNSNMFIYVSTAYVAGKQTGDIKEVFNNIDNNFNNYYEYSKNKAENLVQTLCAHKKLQFRIIRPSIVIGPKSTMQPAGSTTGLYGLVAVINQVTSIANKNNLTVRIPVNGNSGVNLIPVDNVVDDAFALFFNNFTGGPIYHLTSNKCLTFNQCKQVFATLIDMDALDFIDGEIIDPSPLELVIEGKMAFYSAYFQSNKCFERSLTSDNGITESEFKRYCLNAINSSENANLPDVSKESKYLDFGQYKIEIVTISSVADAKEAVILTSAYGMSSEFWINVANDLSHSYDVILWNTVDPVHHTPVKMPFEQIDKYADMLVEAVTSIAKPCHLVGWCTGAGIILQAYENLPNNVLSLVFLNGAFNIGNDETLSDYERSLKAIMAKAAKGRGISDMLFDSIFKHSFVAELGNVVYSEKDTKSLLAAHSARYAHLTSQVYEDSEVFFRYAKAINHYYNCDVNSVLKGIALPVAFIAGSTDQTIALASVDAAKQLATGSEMVVFDQMDHFGLHNDHRVRKFLLDFFKKVR